MSQTRMSRGAALRYALKQPFVQWAKFLCMTLGMSLVLAMLGTLVMTHDYVESWRARGEYLAASDISTYRNGILLAHMMLITPLVAVLSLFTVWHYEFSQARAVKAPAN